MSVGTRLRRFLVGHGVRQAGGGDRHDQCGARGHADLAHGRAQVPLHRPRRQLQALRDPLVGPAEGEQVHDLQFSGRQPVAVPLAAAPPRAGHLHAVPAKEMGHPVGVPAGAEVLQPLLRVRQHRQPSLARSRAEQEPPLPLQRQELVIRLGQGRPRSRGLGEERFRVPAFGLGDDRQAGGQRRGGTWGVPTGQPVGEGVDERAGLARPAGGDESVDVDRHEVGGPQPHPLAVDHA